MGDTHGQYDDFASVLEDPNLGGIPSANNQFVINGDIVDRGTKAVEILMVLLFAKLLCPNSVHILRGNHETENMSNTCGFQHEVPKKYDPQPCGSNLSSFSTHCPLQRWSKNSVFVVLGGIGPLSMELSIEEINNVDRFKEPTGMVDQMLWSGE